MDQNALKMSPANQLAKERSREEDERKLDRLERRSLELLKERWARRSGAEGKSDKGVDW